MEPPVHPCPGNEVTMQRKNRLSAPFMHAFRTAHTARDGRVAAKVGAADGEAAPRRAVITEPQLRREVTRDVGALLNTVNMDSTLPLQEFPEVRRSIINFGLPDLAHRTIDEANVNDIASELERALVDYEPRLVAEGLTTTRDTSVEAADLKIRFVIKADLLCNPVNIPVEFAAEVEIDTGKIRIDRI
ncbi:MAG TPA: type VI secretion system baseplate subunit TssE [Methylomirabilota bacterium]|nr:type VI secretion system baseplate subunit TssE [Methylomirabilota bacterium]